MAKGNRKRKSGADDGEGSDSGEDTVDVTFDFYDLNPIDYHALKHLLSQLLSIRSLSPSEDSATVSPSKAETKPVPADIDVGELADVLLGPQKEWVGGTVKCDGQESDPYAFVSVLDLQGYPDKPFVAALKQYLLNTIQKSATPQDVAAGLHTQLASLLSPSGSGVGLLLSERLVNMPVQIMPHMLRQVGAEIAHAQKNSAPSFAFSHLLIPSRTFIAATDEDDDVAAAPADVKKRKKSKPAQGSGASPELCLFHPEDEIISRFASHTVDFRLDGSATEQPRPEDSFGVEQRGRLMLIELKDWDAMVSALEQYIGGPTAMQVD